MPTPRQQIAVETYITRKKSGKPFTFGGVLRDAGYSESTTKQSTRVRESKGWKEILAKYDDTPVMDRLYATATDGKDKRAQIQAAKLLLVDLKGYGAPTKTQTAIRYNDILEE